MKLSQFYTLHIVCTVHFLHVMLQCVKHETAFTQFQFSCVISVTESQLKLLHVSTAGAVPQRGVLIESRKQRFHIIWAHVDFFMLACCCVLVYNTGTAHHHQHHHINYH